MPCFLYETENIRNGDFLLWWKAARMAESSNTPRDKVYKQISSPDAVWNEVDLKWKETVKLKVKETIETLDIPRNPWSSFTQ